MGIHRLQAKNMHAPARNAPSLRRRLGLSLLVLYGVGITVGAGIYVLIGAVSAHAGRYAPWSFLLAAAVMALTVASYAELATRYPTSAGEAAYVRAAFRSRVASTITGLMTIAIGIISSSAVASGIAGYVEQFVAMPRSTIAILLIAILGAVAAWGILESVLLAALFTIVEVGGLIVVVGAAALVEFPQMFIPPSPPPLEWAALSGVAFASLLAFFAFIGFEDLANIVEEAKHPQRDIPRAMVLTLLIATLIYLTVAIVAINAVPPAQLATSPAPLALVFRSLTDLNPMAISAVAIFAGLNTILAQLTMASRVVYGMARQGDLPAHVGRVHGRTATPLFGTAIVVILAIAFALVVPFIRLAELTSLATLAVFALVNAALLVVHRRHPAMKSHVSVPRWVPALGLAACGAMLATALTNI
jgi:amino acid transporter